MQRSFSFLHSFSLSISTAVYAVRLDMTIICAMWCWRLVDLDELKATLRLVDFDWDRSRWRQIDEFSRLPRRIKKKNRRSMKDAIRGRWRCTAFILSWEKHYKISRAICFIQIRAISHRFNKSNIANQEIFWKFFFFSVDCKFKKYIQWLIKADKF